MTTESTDQATQRALRNTGAAIRLVAQGDDDGAALLLAESDVLISRLTLVHLVCQYAAAAGFDPLAIGDSFFHHAERDLDTTDDEQENTDD